MHSILNLHSISSPISTAGTGYLFEHHVQALYLFNMIGGCDTKLGKLITLQFQAEYEGVHTDDLMCTYTDGNEKTRVFVGCKLTMRVRASDRAFCDALSDAWADYTNAIHNSSHAFRPNQDFIELAYGADCHTNAMSTVGRLIQVARNSNNSVDFAKKCRTKHHLEVLATIYRIVAPDGYSSPPEFLWHFLTRLKWRSFAFNGDGLLHQDVVLEAIVSRGVSSEMARLLWLGLLQTAAKLNGDHATLDNNNMADLIDPFLIQALSGNAHHTNRSTVLSTFPWQAPLWSAQVPNTLSTIMQKMPTFDARELLLFFRSLRIQCWLGNGKITDVATLAAIFATNIDALGGSLDDKAALALFVFLNSTNEEVHRTLVHWSVRCASKPLLWTTSEVEWTLRNLYAHYYGKDASPEGRLAKYVTTGPNHRFRSLVSTPYMLFQWHFMDLFDDSSENNCSDSFDKVRWTIGDCSVDYRQPEQDTSSLPYRQGVASFEALLKAIRCGSISHILSTYHLCTSEATFERLLNTFAEMSAHVQRGIQYISADDTYILNEMRQLLNNSIAEKASNYVLNKLVVLPIQANFPLLNEEVINVPFRNISLAVEFEAAARAEHESLADETSTSGSFYDPKRLWGFESVYADVMLAMTLRTKLFANSRNEAHFANIHGVGVSPFDIRAVFHE